MARAAEAAAEEVAAEGPERATALAAWRAEALPESLWDEERYVGVSIINTTRHTHGLNAGRCALPLAPCCPWRAHPRRQTRPTPRAHRVCALVSGQVGTPLARHAHGDAVLDARALREGRVLSTQYGYTPVTPPIG